MAETMCYTCKTQPAGNDYAGPHSAYCAGCQPRERGLQPRPGQCQCGACGETFASLRDFDAHQHRVAGVFRGECLDPATVGLELAPPGVWGTPEGNANRVRLRNRLHPVEPPSQGI